MASVSYVVVQNLTYTVLALTAVLGTTWLYTTLRYHLNVRRHLNAHSRPGATILEPPQIPYIVPWLGNTLAFLNKRPGGYWSALFKWHPRDTGACTLLLGGQKTHILFSPYAVQALFKARTAKRDVFERDLYQKALDMSIEQIEKAEAGKAIENETNALYLTKHERVNELTQTFTRALDDVLSHDADTICDGESIGLYTWLRNRMFEASTVALMGETVLKMYPEYCEDLFAFDKDFLAFYFGIPKFIMKDAYARRDRIFKKLEEWSRAMHEQSGGEPVDPEGPAWEPLFGSRLTRARQRDYFKRGLNWRTAAASNLGVTFALASNAIPATAWMLMNVLDPKADPTVLSRILGELRESQHSDGTIDVPKLITMPLLNSLWTETLRLFVDALVTRNASEDIILPLDANGKTSIMLRKGDNLFAPCWLGHHDADAWSGNRVSPDEFWAERFLVPDPTDPEKKVFTINGTSGKFFPFGGGYVHAQV